MELENKQGQELEDQSPQEEQRETVQENHTDSGNKCRHVKHKSKMEQQNLKLTQVDLDQDYIQINDSLIITKDDVSKFLVFKWIAGEKNDIIADCLALMFSQFPSDESYDMFQEQNKPGESTETKELRVKLTKRVLGLFSKATYAVQGKELLFDLRDATDTKLVINLETGDIKSSKDSLTQRFESALGSLLTKIRSQTLKQPTPTGQHTNISHTHKNFGGGAQEKLNQQQKNYPKNPAYKPQSSNLSTLTGQPMPPPKPK